VRGIEKLTWDGFGGINTRADAYDLKSVQGVEATNVKLSRAVGKIVKCPGYSTAVLKGTPFSTDGLGGRTINALGVLHTSHQAASSPYYVCQAGTDNKFYYWNAGTWTELTGMSTTVDTGVVKFIRRSGALVALTGSGEDNNPVLISFANETFKYAYKDGDKTIGSKAASLSVSNAHTYTTDDITFGCTLAVDYNSSWNWSGRPAFPPNVTVAYKFALQFDGFQWGPVCDSVYTINTGSTDDQAAISMMLSLDASTISQRVTGIKVYRCVDYHGNPDKDTFKLLRTIDVNEDISWPGYFTGLNADSEVATGIAITNYPNPLGGSGQYAQAAYTGSLNFVMTESTMTFGNDCCTGMILGVKSSSFTEDDLATADADFFDALLPISGSVGAGSDAIQVLEDGGLANGTYYIVPLYGWYKYYGNYYYGIYDTHMDITSAPTIYEDIGYIEDENVDLNYEIAHITGKRQAVAWYWDGEVTNKTNIRVSAISPDGTYDYDVFHADDVISLQEYGVTEIMGIASWRNSFLVFTKEDLIIMDPASNNAFTWSLYDTIQRVGLVAPKSLVTANNNLYYMNNNGPYRFREGTSELLPDIVNPDNWPLNVTDLSECVAVLDNARDEVLFAFPSDNKLYAFDLLSQSWTVYDVPISPRVLLRDNDDSLYICDGSDMVTLDYASTDFDGTAIVPVYKSKELKFQDDLIRPYGFEVRYNCDTEFLVKMYYDGTLVATRTIPSGDTETFQKLGAGKLCNKFQFEITLSSAHAATNTKFEIRSFTFLYKKVGRV